MAKYMLIMEEDVLDEELRTALMNQGIDPDDVEIVNPKSPLGIEVLASHYQQEQNKALISHTVNICNRFNTMNVTPRVRFEDRSVIPPQYKVKHRKH